MQKRRAKVKRDGGEEGRGRIGNGRRAKRLRGREGKGEKRHGGEED
jgi:hypothetical protein